MMSHWLGIYANGQETGFKTFQEVVKRLHTAFDNLIWMKLSEIARYWAVKELTRIERTAAGIAFHAPFACPDFTVRLNTTTPPKALKEVNSPLRLTAGTFTRTPTGLIACFNLQKGPTHL